MKYARVVNSLVVEVFTAVDDATGNPVELAAVFPPALAAQFEPCADEVRPGWTKSGDEWSAPPPAPPPPSRPTLVITSVESSDPEHTEIGVGFGMISCPVGTTLAFTAELRFAGQLVPESNSFLMPLVSRDGRERVLQPVMVDGVATVAAPMNESGVWQVTEAQINSDLPAHLQMAFAGIRIFVVLQ